MLLDRIDIDVHGPLHRVQIGPFSEQLNVVCGPGGSGKTAIARFIRDSLVHRQYPLGMMSSSTGRVVWADRNGTVHCYREKNGTKEGRTTVEFEPRGDDTYQYGHLDHSWMAGIGDTTDASRAKNSIRIPESLVDGVITDTAITNLARIVSTCVSNGLDSLETYRSLPLMDPSTMDSANRNEQEIVQPFSMGSSPTGDRSGNLRAQLADVEAEIARLDSQSLDHHVLVQRRSELTSRLARLRYDSGVVGVGRRSGRHGDDGPNAEAINTEMRRIDSQLALLARYRWLQVRRSQLVDQLKVVRPPFHAGSPLSEAASHWLVRLSAGRLRRIDWPSSNFSAGQSFARGVLDPRESASRRTGIRIDGRDEAQAPAADQALAVIAVRMAAGELLARTGRPVPLVIELHRAHAVIHQGDAETAHGASSYAFCQHGEDGRGNHPMAAAFRDYARAGRQLVLLTADGELSSQISRAGGRLFQLHSQRVVHPHRPLWRPHYEAERYVGPHPHIHGEFHAGDSGRPARSRPARPRPERPIVEINRDFDSAWQDAGGNETAPIQPVVREPASTDWAAAGQDYRDGYYYADTYTTVDPHARGQFDSNESWGSASWGDEAGDLERSRSIENPLDATNHQPGNSGLGNSGLGDSGLGDSGLRNTDHRVAASKSPFFLNVDSPIDQAPSLDGVAAARLRGLGVTHINHLMQQDSNRLSDALGLASVNASTIRRWKAECRLACQVPQLRGFDARILVGCGVTNPGELAAIHPMRLLQNVEAFLATDKGRRILLSGSSHELSRITSWIATANSTPAERATAERRNNHDYRLPSSDNNLANVFDPSQEAQSGEKPDHSDRSRRRRSQDGKSRDRNLVRFRRQPNELASEKIRNASESTDQPIRHRDGELRFYLRRSSPVVDAPAIGPRMSERLAGVGIQTVDDLLSTDPESIATELDHRRVDCDCVVEWQQQAELVCRVPMLRGHDAQLLVVAGVTSPEELASCDPQELFGLIDPISRSKQGKRILRGGKLPDLQEITEWIGCAMHTRELMAA